MWIALIVSTLALLAFFYTLKFSTSTAVTPSFGWYIFCGALWGISLIVPGMSSSSLLMFLGLYQPMSAGIAQTWILTCCFRLPSASSAPCCCWRG